jgi:phage recombination protein Bet
MSLARTSPEQADDVGSDKISKKATSILGERIMNEQAIVKTGVALSTEDIQTLISASIIPQDTPVAVIKMFARFCAENELSPFKRQVHLIKRGERFTIQTGIDGYRSIADRTGRYAGNDDYLFDEGLSEYQHVVQKKGANPITATATVYKLVGNTRVPFAATARWIEYCPPEGQNFMWKKMPYLMLGKTAEALALRKAFPNELGGVYTDEEMQQAGPITELSPQSPQESAGEGTAEAEHPRPINIAGANFEQFDPKTETIKIGKYKGTIWMEIPKDYLEWMVQNATKPELKSKAQATLDYESMIQEQASKEDPFDGVFDRPAPGPLVPSPSEPSVEPIELLEHSLDEVARKRDLNALEDWWKINFEQMKKLNKNAQAHITKLYIAVKKESQGVKS